MSSISRHIPGRAGGLQRPLPSLLFSSHPPIATLSIQEALSIILQNVSKIVVNFATIGKTLLLPSAATQAGNIFRCCFVFPPLHFQSEWTSVLPSFHNFSD